MYLYVSAVNWLSTIDMLIKSKSHVLIMNGLIMIVKLYVLDTIMKKIL
jgi:hypothetical protein